MEESIGVLFGCFGRKIIIYQDHLFALKGHLWMRDAFSGAKSSLFDSDYTWRTYK